MSQTLCFVTECLKSYVIFHLPARELIFFDSTTGFWYLNGLADNDAISASQTSSINAFGYLAEQRNKSIMDQTFGKKRAVHCKFCTLFRSRTSMCKILVQSAAEIVN
jgi:hypothetical protein